MFGEGGVRVFSRGIGSVKDNICVRELTNGEWEQKIVAWFQCLNSCEGITSFLRKANVNRK